MRENTGKSTRLMTRQTMRTMSMLMLSEMESEKRWRKWEENKLVAAGEKNGKIALTFLFFFILPHSMTHVPLDEANKSSAETLRKLNFTLIYLFMALTENLTWSYVCRGLLFIFHLPSLLGGNWNRRENKGIHDRNVLMSRHAIKWEFVWNLFTKRRKSWRVREM